MYFWLVERQLSTWVSWGGVELSKSKIHLLKFSPKWALSLVHLVPALSPLAFNKPDAPLTEQGFWRSLVSGPHPLFMAPPYSPGQALCTSPLDECIYLEWLSPVQPVSSLPSSLLQLQSGLWTFTDLKRGTLFWNLCSKISKASAWNLTEFHYMPSEERQYGYWY